jgi:hypothetical protein
MKLGACFVAALLTLAPCWTVRAEDASAENVQPPDTGIDALGSGGALAAIGTLMFATAPICKTAVISPKQQGTCFAVSFGAGAPFLALGIPLIAYGAVQHAKYGDWARRHPALGGLSLSPSSRGGAIAWSARF